jgi:hypothetical protein
MTLITRVQSILTAGCVPAQHDMAAHLRVLHFFTLTFVSTHDVAEVQADFLQGV